MRYVLIFFLIFSFSCSEDSVTNDPDNNGGNTGDNNNNNNSGPSGNVFTFGDEKNTRQYSFYYRSNLIPCASGRSSV